MEKCRRITEATPGGRSSDISRGIPREVHYEIPIEILAGMVPEAYSRIPLIFSTFGISGFLLDRNSQPFSAGISAVIVFRVL